MTQIDRQVAETLGISAQACRRIAYSAYRRYKVFEIPKRNGRGTRVVAQPAREVKAVQRALIEILGPNLPVHVAAMAYRRGLSIRDNALLHADARFLTKLDFIDFFPSINAGTIARHLRSHIPEISDADVSFVLEACLWKPGGLHCLCIGAPSSPMLSNSVMLHVDQAAYEECRGMDVIYSRYSDDISISSSVPNVLALAERRLRDIFAQSQYPVIRVNEHKRVAVGRGAAMRVTGLTLTNGGLVSVGRARKRGVRAGAKRYVRGTLNWEQIEALKGEIAFVLSIEPEFREVLERTYGPAVFGLLPRRDQLVPGQPVSDI